MKILLSILLLTLQHLFALVSIVPVEIGQTPGYSGSLELGLDSKRGNTDKEGYTGSFLLNYDNNSSFVIWLELNGAYAEVNNVVNTNKLYSHLRYIHALDEESFRAELFLQAQEDEFKALKKRRLAGGGLRYKLFKTFTNGTGHFGLGGFYEYLRHTEPSISPNEDNVRMNTYLDYTVKFNNNSNLAYNLYYQPRFNDFSDFALTNKFELQIHVYLQIFLKFSIYYDYDSRPPTSLLEKYDFGQTTTFVYNF